MRPFSTTTLWFGSTRSVSIGITLTPLNTVVVACAIGDAEITGVDAPVRAIHEIPAMMAANATRPMRRREADRHSFMWASGLRRKTKSQDDFTIITSRRIRQRPVAPPQRDLFIDSVDGKYQPP
jgi:hypothetical protein